MMNKNPKVSIIIPCYNHGQYIMDAIESVERYEPKEDYEIIIVNDGSTDEFTNKLLNELSVKGYYVIQKENGGLSSARNTGIKNAQALYILPLDSDNKIRPAYIKEGIRILDRDVGIGVVYSNPFLFGERSGGLKRPDFDIEKLFRFNYIDACAVYRKIVWEEVNGYDEHKTMHLGWEDWDFWMRVALRGWSFYHIDRELFDYRVRKDSMLRSETMKNRATLINYIFSKKEYQVISFYLKKAKSIKWLFAQILKNIYQKLFGAKGR